MHPIVRFLLAAIIVILSLLVCVPGAYYYWYYATHGVGSAPGMSGFIESLLYIFSIPFSFFVSLMAAVLGKLAEGSERYVYVFSAVLSSFPWLVFLWLLVSSPH